MSITHTAIHGTHTHTHCHTYAVESNAISQKFNQIETEHFWKRIANFFSCEDVSAVSETVTTNCPKLELAPDISERVNFCRSREVSVCYHVALVLTFWRRNYFFFKF